MKFLIAFYSRTKGTEKVAQALKNEFEERGHSVEMEEIRPRKEHGFWGWWFLRMVREDCGIHPPEIRDVSMFDAICLGGPNWTRLSLPVARYIKEVDGLKYKNIGFFATTFAPPVIEKYALSAYLLDATFSQQISKKGGRIIDALLFSSFFKKESVFSEQGRKAIKDFCSKLETPISSLKNYFLEQKEIENTRFLAVLFSSFLFFSFFFQLLSSVFGWQILNWSGYFFLFATQIFIYFIILTILTSRVYVFLGKYLAGLSIIFGLTAAFIFLSPALGRSIILSYALALFFFIFFKNPKTIIFLGGLILSSYFYLFYNYPLKGVLFPSLDLSFIFLIVGVAILMAKNLQDSFVNMLDDQEEIEITKNVLEIKVKARTKELRELSGGLERQVQKRTGQLQEKIQELEKFNKLSVGRELKMISLKEEINQLKKIKESKAQKR